MSRIARLTSAAAVAGLILCGSAAAVQRTFVSSTGSDANTASSCGVASPCRGFAAAQTVTSDGGEIVALDAAGYGPITITQNITIIANPGFYAGITAPSGNAVTIATASINVRLVGLKINGQGTGTKGIVMSNGSSLTVEDCSVTGFTSNAIEVTTAARVRVSNTTAANNGGSGIVVSGGAKVDVVGSRFFSNFVGVFSNDNGSGTPPTSVAATNVVASENSYGFVVQAFGTGAIGHLTVSDSTADHNTFDGFRAGSGAGLLGQLSVSSSKSSRNGSFGFNNVGSATFNSGGNNLVQDNATNLGGTITNVGLN